MLRVEDAFIGAFGDRLQVLVSSVLGNSLFFSRLLHVIDPNTKVLVLAEMPWS